MTADAISDPDACFELEAQSGTFLAVKCERVVRGLHAGKIKVSVGKESALLTLPDAVKFGRKLQAYGSEVYMDLLAQGAGPQVLQSVVIDACVECGGPFPNGPVTLKGELIKTPWVKCPSCCGKDITR